MTADQVPLWVYIIISAATGAVASALLNLVGQWRERAWKRKELLLNVASKLSIEHTNKVMRIAERNNQEALIYDHVHVTADYYNWLNHLIDKDELPEEAKPKLHSEP